MNINTEQDIQTWLHQQPQMTPKADGFGAIMEHINQQQNQRSFRLPAIAAIALAALLWWQLPQLSKTQNSEQQLAQQTQQLALLTAKIARLEQVVRNEMVNHSAPGSHILETMVAMENWLDQLDLNIAQVNETGHKLELLHAKLKILGDLMALHTKQPTPPDTHII